MSLGIAGIGAGECVERCRDHELEIALGEHHVGILPVEHFALLGDADLAVEGADRLRIDGSVRGAAAAPDSASAAVKKTELDAALVRDLVQGAVGAEDLPG